MANQDRPKTRKAMDLDAWRKARKQGALRQFISRRRMNYSPPGLTQREWELHMQLLTEVLAASKPKERQEKSA